MKKNTRNIRYFMTVLMMSLLGTVYAVAQDSSSTVTKNTSASTSSATAPDPSAWYMQPWAWVAGGVLVLIILIVLLRGSGNKRTEVTRTTITRTDETGTV